MHPMLQDVLRWNGIVTAVSIALTFAGVRLLGVEVDPVPLAVVACGTFVVYGVDRRATFSPEDRVRGQSAAPTPVAALVVAWVALGLLTWQEPRGRAVILALGALGALYILPTLPGRRRLKDVPYIKTFVVAGGWAVATIVLPALYGDLDLDARIWCLVGYRMLFLLPNLLLADWPDRVVDRTVGIRTIANGLDPSRFVRVCRAVCLISIASALLLWVGGVLPTWAILETATPIGYLLILRRSLPESQGFYTTIVDFLPAWPGLVAILFG